MIDATSSFTTSMFLGPLGGYLALAYAAGTASGWGFCAFTVLKISNKQIEELKVATAAEKVDCDRRIRELEARVKEVEDRYMSGMERQAGQVRQSTVEILGSDGPTRRSRR